jgi:hypothetical protein
MSDWLRAAKCDDNGGTSNGTDKCLRSVSMNPPVLSSIGKTLNSHGFRWLGGYEIE